MTPTAFRHQTPHRVAITTCDKRAWTGTPPTPRHHHHRPQRRQLRQAATSSTATRATKNAPTATTRHRPIDRTQCKYVPHKLGYTSYPGCNAKRAHSAQSPDHIQGTKTKPPHQNHHSPTPPDGNSYGYHTAAHIQCATRSTTAIPLARKHTHRTQPIVAATYPMAPTQPACRRY